MAHLKKTHFHEWFSLLVCLMGYLSSEWVGCEVWGGGWRKNECPCWCDDNLYHRKGSKQSCGKETVVKQSCGKEKSCGLIVFHEGLLSLASSLIK